jgi:hypothetical protein
VIRLVDVYDPTGPGGIRGGALEWLYELMKEREPEINISHRELPTFEQHRQFVTRRPYRFWYLIETAADTPELVIAGIRAGRGRLRQRHARQRDRHRAAEGHSAGTASARGGPHADEEAPAEPGRAERAQRQLARERRAGERALAAHVRRPRLSKNPGNL